MVRSLSLVALCLAGGARAAEARAGLADGVALLQQAAEFGPSIGAFGKKKGLARASFFSDDKEICWDVPETKLGWTRAALMDSPLEKFATLDVGRNMSCPQAGFTILVKSMEPCFKDTAIYKADTTLLEVRQVLAKPIARKAYNSNVKGKEMKLNDWCYGENRPINERLMGDPVGLVMSTMNKVGNSITDMQKAAKKKEKEQKKKAMEAWTKPGAYYPMMGYNPMYPMWR